MKLKEVKVLVKGDYIEHSRYGVCRVKENVFSFGNWFGLSIMPITDKGMGFLHADSGSFCNCFLEDSLRRLRHKAIPHKMPKFVLANDENLESYGLYEWEENKAGELDEKGDYCFIKVKDFATRDEALDYREKQRNGKLEEIEN